MATTCILIRNFKTGRKPVGQICSGLANRFSYLSDPMRLDQINVRKQNVFQSEISKFPLNLGHGHILRNDDPSNDISRLLEDDCSNTLLELEPTCRLLESHEYFEDNGHEYFLYSTNLQGTCIRAICQTMQNVFEVYSSNAIQWIVILKDMSFSNIIMIRINL